MPQQRSPRSAFALFLLAASGIGWGVFLPKAHAASPDISKDGLQVGQVQAQVLAPSKKNQSIPDLTLKEGPLPVILVTSRLQCAIQGVEPDPDWSLVTATGTPIVRSETDGSFKIDVPISQPETTVVLDAVDPYGKVRTTRISLKAENWQAIQNEIRKAEASESYRRFHWGLGAGLTHLDYSQAGIPDLSSFLLSTHVHAEYWLKPDAWDLTLSGYFTPVPLSTSPSGYSIEFLGINARAGYVLPQLPSPWRLTLMAGIYYATTFTSAPTGVSFGYVNIGGPEIFPTLSRELRSGSSASAYFKFSPVSDQFTILSLTNREIAAGLAYHLPPDHVGRNLSLTFDWANLTVQGGAAQASSSTETLGAGYQW